jgi:hypothetical protein
VGQNEKKKKKRGKPKIRLPGAVEDTEPVLHVTAHPCFEFRETAIG